MKILIILLYWFTYSLSVYSKDCDKSFKDIDKNCIIDSLEEVETSEVQLSKNSVGDVYVYTTDQRGIGKFEVLSFTKSKNSCVLFYNAETFTGNKSFISNTDIKIANLVGVWESKEINLDRSGNGVDIKFYQNESGECAISSLNGKFGKHVNLIQANQNTAGDLLFYGCILLMGIATFIISRVIFEEEGQFKAQEALDDIETEEKTAKKNNDIVLKYSRPLFRRYFTPIVKGMKGQKKIREKYKKPLASAGLTSELSPEDFFAFKLFLILGFPILFLALRSFLEESWPLELTPVLSIVGFVYPDIWLKGKIDRRRDEIIANMPFVVDLLALSVEAGLDFMAAITRVIEKAPPSALVDEFETLIKETRVGASRSEALRNLSWRIDNLAISSFCATLIAADSVGASIGPILKTLAGEMRQKRSTVIEKKGAAAATKLLFPMMFLTMPAVVIIIFTPMVLKFIGP